MEPIRFCAVEIKGLGGSPPRRICPFALCGRQGRLAKRVVCSLPPKSETFVDRKNREDRSNSSSYAVSFNSAKYKSSSQTESRKAVVRMSRPQLSGEVFKEPFLDIFLTDLEQTAFSLNLDNRISSEHAPVELHVKIGDYVHSGDTVGKSQGERLIVRTSGRIVRISRSQIVVQKTQPVLYYSQARVHVKEQDWVERNTPILTLTHQTLVTGDIVQGIPRIEQLFEAVHSPAVGVGEKSHFQETLHSQMREIFRQNWGKAALPAAVRQSLEQIQQILVESIQKVYLLQGVLIADKHIEIIVRQMTCRAQVLDSGDTGLLLGELLPVQQIENANLTAPGKKALYAPAVVGLTRSALESDSFLSAASFQESTRVLSRHALIGKSDLVRGLKEKVVIGDLISAGTGLDIYFVYTLLFPDQSFSTVPTEIERGVSSLAHRKFENNLKS